MTETTTIPTVYGLFDRRIRITKARPARTYPFSLDYDMRTLWFALELPLFEACTICGKIDSAINMEITADGNVLCDHCRKESTIICARCGELHMLQRGHVYNVRTATGAHVFVCARCYTEVYKQCDGCQQSFSMEDDISLINGRFLCDDCLAEFNRKYFKCHTCNTYQKIERLDPESGKCFTCALKAKKTTEKKRINGYEKTRGTVFFSTQDHGHVYGTELEVTGGRECDDLLRELAEFPEVVLKRDGSVPGGMEIVSYPMSLGYHKSFAKWDKMFRILEKYGYKSHDTTNCGYHIHMSRLTFGDTQRKQSTKIAYLLYLVQKFEAQIRTFSRRSQYNYCKFYTLDYDALSVTRAYQKAVNYNHHSRYQVLNFQNEHTIECRVFRGTMNYQTFIAAIELLEHLTRIVMNASNETEIRAITWNKVTSTIPAEFGSLREYVIRKKLI